MLKYRITREANIWTDRVCFYPESRPRWWPFWSRFDDGHGYQVVFSDMKQAKRFIDSAKKASRDQNNLEGAGPTEEERRANARAIQDMTVPERFDLMFHGPKKQEP